MMVTGNYLVNILLKY